MEITIVVHDDDGKYLAENNSNSIQEAKDFLDSLIIDKSNT